MGKRTQGRKRQVEPSGVHVGGAVDLGGLSQIEKVQALQVAAETKAGMRCNGCKERITVGFEFVTFAPVTTPEGIVMQTLRTFACSRDECDYSSKAAKDSLAHRLVEWAWITPAVRERAAGAVG